MRRFHREYNPIKRDEIAGHTLRMLKQHHAGFALSIFPIFCMSGDLLPNLPPFIRRLCSANTKAMPFYLRFFTR